jgi:MFS family permease
MNRFSRYNNIIGWGVFGIALITYLLTVERTASFWDCGEFIACAFKLQVPHPPGAPFFLLLGRLFSMLSFGDLEQAAYWVNVMSVVASAFTILFLFWTITMLARKVIGKTDEALTTADTYLVLGAGVVGALTYTWSDSFWFSAVEAEVYGLSSFFTAIVIWAAFRWERIENNGDANRWLLFIAYLVGLSIGVHLLNLVTIPALALIYYFKKYKNHSIWGMSAAFLVGLVILGIINSAIIPGLPTIAGQFEIFFVNSIGLPYTSGIIIFIVLFLGLLVFGVRYSEKHGKETLNVSLLSLVFVLVGYMSYILVLVRAEFNPPINENNPNDVLSFVSYLKREQYGSRPLLFGPTFVDRPVSQKRGAPMYMKEGGKYKIYDYKPEYEYPSGSSVLFPRMYSTQQRHVQLYQQMQGLGENQRPNLANNISFMLSYQIGHMYWRYFLWNFVGRESDEEGAGTLLPWDAAKEFPSSIANNKAHDNFFMLPFILGLLGIVYHYFRRKNDLLILALLFILTGVALVIYLNSPPEEPRERDYIYVGSFYIFTMWVGLGVLFVADLLRKILANETTRSLAATALGLLVPAVMVAKGWDNHNRNNRYHSVDFAKNMLNTCAPNAILFTGGDNDTFPLWYVQEVEGFRTDVRVCNLSLLGTDWYIDQMKRKTYDSEPLPISLEKKNYMYGRNDVVPFYEVPRVKGGINLKEYISLVKDENRAIQVPLTSGDMTSILPSSVLFLPVDTEAVKKKGIVKEDLVAMLRDSISWSIGNRDLYKSDLIMLDIIANNDWNRPIYFSSTLGNSSYLNLKEYLQLEGYAYRLLPVKVDGASDGYVNSEVMYDRMMNNMAWRELDNPNTYYDNTFLGSPVLSARISFLRLVNQLISEGKKEEARAALKRSLETMPDASIPYDQISVNFIGPAIELGEDEIASDIAETMSRRADENLDFAKLSGNPGGRNSNLNLYILQSIMTAYQEEGKTEEAKKYEALLQKHYGMANFAR